jgi:hypothetical protein
MTSAAETEIETHQDGVYIPNGIVSCAGGGYLIHERDDNIDSNAEKIDGKNTFHSVARVVFQERSAAVQQRHILQYSTISQNRWHFVSRLRVLCDVLLRKLLLIIKLYCHIQHILYDELECSLALTHILPIQ